MGGEDTTVRLISGSNTDDKKVKTKIVKPEKDKDFVIWQSGINGSDEKKIAKQYLLKNIKDFKYSILDQAQDGGLSSQQQEFLLKNQLFKVEQKDANGKITYAYEKQGKSADEKITKAEIEDIFKLRDSIGAQDEANLSPEEKEFKNSFDSTFGKKGEKDVQTYHSDLEQSGTAFVYAFYRGFSDYKPNRKLKQEKDIMIDTDQNGKADTLMSEQEMYERSKQNGEHIQKIAVIKTIEEYTDKDGKYKNIEEYVEKMPKNVKKKIYNADEVEAQQMNKQVIPQNSDDVDPSLYEKMLQKYYSTKTNNETNPKNQ